MRLGLVLAALLRLFLFKHHVAILHGVKNFPTHLAFNEFGVLVARHHPNLRMSALLESGLERRNERILPRDGKGVNGL